VSGSRTQDPANMAKALDAGYKRLKWARESFARNCRERAGRHYGAKKDNKPRPVNLLSQFVETITPNLLNQRPKHSCKSRMAELRGEADLLAMAVDMLWEQQNLVDLVQDVIQDALLSPFGIAKIGLRAGEDIIKIGDEGIMLGSPYVQRVSPNDFNIDPAARSLREAGWMANRYRICKEYALDSGIYDPDAINRLVSMQNSGQSTADSKVETLSVGGDNRFEGTDLIELWDVAMREENRWLIGTISAVDGTFSKEWVNAGAKLLEYNGDAAGPFEILTFHRIPDNTPGLSPGSTWMDLHEAIDKLYWKMIRQALRARQMQISSRGAHDDALTLKEAADGDHLEVDDVNQHKVLDFGGVQKDAYPFIGSLMEMWNNAAGNMQLLSGSGLQTDKATGQSILQANAQTRLGFQKDKTWRFCSSLSRRLADYCLTDPEIKLPLPYKTMNGQTYTMYYDAATRQGGPMGKLALEQIVQATLQGKDVAKIEEEAKAHFIVEVDQNTMVGRDPELVVQRKLETMGILAKMGVPFLPIPLARQIGRDIGWTDLDEAIGDIDNQAMLAGAMGMAPMQAPPAGQVPPGAPVTPGMPQVAAAGPQAQAQQGMQAYGRGAPQRGVA